MATAVTCTLSDRIYRSFQSFLIGAFAFIAAQAINSAFQAIIEKIFPDKKRQAVIAKIVYAIVMTVFAIVVIILLALYPGSAC